MGIKTRKEIPKIEQISSSQARYAVIATIRISSYPSSMKKIEFPLLFAEKAEKKVQKAHIDWKTNK
jgi:hypothetical protein